MALTELERTLIETVQRSQQQQTETIERLSTQVSSLSAQVKLLSEAYSGLAQVYCNGTEHSE